MVVPSGDQRPGSSQNGRPHGVIRRTPLPSRLTTKSATFALAGRLGSMRLNIATVVDALRRIVDGETVIDPTIVSRLVGRRRRQDPLAALSGREREVLGLIAEGMSNRAIAARLYVTERTVEAHVTQI